MIGNNPEFDRNLWLELTPHRLVALPVVFGLLLMLNLSLNDYQLLKPAAYAAIGLFLLFTGIWGAKCASGSIYEEVVGRTWDWQRLSGLDPWPMTWGKLFGATAFAWYGGLLCLAVAAVGLHDAGAGMREWLWLLLALFTVLFAHALGLFLNLLYIRSRPLERARSGGSLYLFVILMMLMASWALGPSSEESIRWYGYSLPLLEFTLGSVIIAWLWTLLGAYRVMRREFLHAARPWIWLGFLLFLALYIGGLTGHSPVEWGFTAFLLWWAATILALFVEHKDPVALRGLLSDLGQGDWDRASLRMPSWLIALLLATAAAVLVLLAFAAGRLGWKGEGDVAVALIVPALLCFMLRDVALFLLLGFAADAKRPEVSAVVYLILLYFIVPSLLGTLGLEGLSALFIPRPDLAPPLALGGPLLGLALAAALLIRQWGRLSRPVN